MSVKGMINWVVTLLSLLLWCDDVHSFSMKKIFRPNAAFAQPIIEKGISSQDPNYVYATGAGIYFWWQLGVAKYMKEHCVPEAIYSTNFIGASAGSITSAMLLAGADLEKLPLTALEISKKSGLYSRKNGLAGVWGRLLREWLETSIPADVDMENFRNFQVALSPTFGKPILVGDLSSREEVIDAVMASCHVPLFLDGTPYTNFKGNRVFDGSFWYFVTKDRMTGLPLPFEDNNNNKVTSKEEAADAGRSSGYDIGSWYLNSKLNPYRATKTASESADMTCVDMSSPSGATDSVDSEMISNSIDDSAASMDDKRIYWIDYTDDEDFMQTVSGNFLELVTPEGLFEMIDQGYNFMKREHYQGNMPYAKSDRPQFVGAVGAAASAVVTAVPVPGTVAKRVIVDPIRNLASRLSYVDVSEYISTANAYWWALMPTPGNAFPGTGTDTGTGMGSSSSSSRSGRPSAASDSGSFS